MTAIIYGWATRPDFLLPRLYPEAHLINAKPFVDADMIRHEARTHWPRSSLWFFHLNISRSERWLLDRNEIVAYLKSTGYRVVNDRIVDYRKSTLQELNRQLGLADVSATPDDDSAMTVMVKSNYNYGGLGESLLSPEELLGLGLRSMAGCPVNSFDQYYRCQLSEVSELVWQDPRLVVEKYIDNSLNAFYRFYRCGTRAVLSEVINKEVIKKMTPGLPRRNWYFNFGEECPGFPGDIVPGANRMCDAAGLEFGALDIVVDNDNCPYIIDLNPTPGWGRERQGKMLNFLAQGIEPIVAGR